MFSNNLSESEIERLALLSEECAEVIVIVGKILRHGYDSCNPDGATDETNTGLLEQELGDVQYSIDLMVRFNDINAREIQRAMQLAAVKKPKYLHHQPLSTTTDHDGQE